MHANQSHPTWRPPPSRGYVHVSFRDTHYGHSRLPALGNLKGERRGQSLDAKYNLRAYSSFPVSWLTGRCGSGWSCEVTKLRAEMKVYFSPVLFSSISCESPAAFHTWRPIWPPDVHVKGNLLLMLY